MKIAKIKQSVQEIDSGKILINRNMILLGLLILSLAISAYLLISPSIDTDKQKLFKKTTDRMPVSTITTTQDLFQPTKSTATPTPTIVSNLPPPNFGRQIKIPILYYHYIGNNPNPKDLARNNLSLSPSDFEAQMGYLSKNGFNPISFDTMYAGLKGNIQLAPNSIILTFDDGYIDFYVNAFPLLRKYNFHAVSFIPTGLVGQGYYLTWDQIKEMDATGLISFQAHSVDHYNLTTINSLEIKHQVQESKKVLEDKLGKPVNFFAYPYGASNEAVWQTVKDTGFVGAAGTWESNTVSEGVIFDMPRIKIPGGISIEQFASKIR